MIKKSLEQKTEKPGWKQWLPFGIGCYKVFKDLKNKKPTIIDFKESDTNTRYALRRYGFIFEQALSIAIPLAWGFLKYLK